MLALAGAETPDTGTIGHFGDYALLVADAARDLAGSAREPEWFRDWAFTWRKLYDNFEKLRAADPMMVYRPRNPTAAAFHSSPAFIRYFRAGNRTSKTQSGYAEHYFSVTGFHPFRPMPPGAASTFIVCGLPFTDYAPKVFEKKMLYGEDGPHGRNPLSPMFPEDGKWFYHYSAKNHTITIACPECAAKGKAQSCAGHHKKTTISLVSAEKGHSVVEAFTARLGHGDEHIPETFLDAMKMRVGDQLGYLIFTGTPLQGLNSWENRRLGRVAEGDKQQNRKDPLDPNSEQYVSLHWCSKWDGQIVSHSQIRTEAQDMDEFERESRIEGRPAPLARNPVFDRQILYEMRERCTEPVRGVLSCKVPLTEAHESTKVEFSPSTDGALRVWEGPDEGAGYLISVDTAAGLSPGSTSRDPDPSCASVFKVIPSASGPILDMVAQYHGWITMLDYADEVFKLALRYNSALVVVELTGGYGRAVLERLKGGKDGSGLCYWNIFRDAAKGEYAEPGQDGRFGIDTTAFNKASMVAALQHFVKERRIRIPCKDTITEMVAFEQERTELGNARFRGAGGAHDDRCMSLVIAAAVAVSYPIVEFGADMQESRPPENYEGEWKEIHKELDVTERQEEYW